MVFHPFKSRKLIVNGHSFAILLRIGAIRWSFYRFVGFIPRVWGQGRIITQAHKLKIRNNDLRSAESACVIEKDKERPAQKPTIRRSGNMGFIQGSRFKGLYKVEKRIVR